MLTICICKLHTGLSLVKLNRKILMRTGPFCTLHTLEVLPAHIFSIGSQIPFIQSRSEVLQLKNTQWLPSYWSPRPTHTHTHTRTSWLQMNLSDECDRIYLHVILAVGFLSRLNANRPTSHLSLYELGIITATSSLSKHPQVKSHHFPTRIKTVRLHNCLK